MIVPAFERVNLVGVDLVSVEARTNLSPKDLPERPPRLSVDACATGFLEGRIITAEISLAVKGMLRDEPGEDAVLRITAEYRLEYILKDDEPAPSADEIRQLANVSGIYNVWPFFREFVASLYAKMNLPLPLLPTITPAMVAAMPWEDRAPRKRGKTR